MMIFSIIKWKYYSKNTIILSGSSNRELAEGIIEYHIFRNCWIFEYQIRKCNIRKICWWGMLNLSKIIK